MTTSKLTSILILIVASTISSYAQEATGFNEGYIVTLENDTIKGLVKNVNAFPYNILFNVKFKEYDDDKAREYEADKLKGYMINQEIYHSRIADGSPLFVKKVVGGELSLYEKTSSFMQSNGLGGAYMRTITVQYVYRNGDKELTEVKRLGFRKRFSRYFQDDKELSDIIKEGKLKQSDIEFIVSEYNFSKKLKTRGRWRELAEQ